MPDVTVAYILEEDGLALKIPHMYAYEDEKLVCFGV